MLVFITSVRHPYNSNSYLRVSELLDETLASVCAQTSANFRVIVVCNQIPELRPRDRVEFVTVDFPAPSQLSKPTTGMQAIRLDRGTKYVIGLIYAQRYAPDYIMFFDADDYISNRIVAYVDHHPESLGWYFEQGYIYRQNSNKVKLIKDFQKRCGTSHIFHQSLFSLPSELNVRSSLEAVMGSVDARYLFSILGSHRIAQLFYKNKGIDLKILPFPGAIWVLGNGENHSGWRGEPGDLLLTENLIDEFGFPDTKIDSCRTNR